MQGAGELVMLAGQVLLVIGEALCKHSKLADLATPLEKTPPHAVLCELVLQCLEQTSSHDETGADLLSTHPHLISLLHLLTTFDPSLEPVR